MHIDSYRFGHIVVDGVAYNSDLLIIAGAVRPNWWRKQGHLLSAEDLQVVIEAKPSIVIIGCGASAMMKVPEETRQTLHEHNIQSEVLGTHKAVQRFNQLAAEDPNVAAALHLTC